MRTKFFIVMAIIQIVVSLYTLSVKDEIVDAIIEGQDEIDKIISSYMNPNTDEQNEDQSIEIASNDNSDALLEGIDLPGAYDRYVILYAVYCIISSVIIIWYASKDEILKHRNLIVAFSVISFILGLTIFNYIISVALLVVVMCLKRENPGDYPEPKRKIEKVEYEQKNKNNIIKAIFTILIYFTLYALFPNALQVIFPNMSAKLFLVIGLIVPSAVVFIVIFELFKKEIKISLDAIKENKRSYKYLILKTFIITLIIVAIANIIRAVLIGGISENQKELNQMNYLLLLPLAVIFAPFVEECVFRGAIRKFINNKYVFILVSGLVF